LFVKEKSMELKNYIDIGVKETGSQKNLANLLGQKSEAITAAKANRRGLPIDACIKLARLINADPLEVIAASELTTEKKPEKREFWRPFVEHAHAACALLAVTAALTLMPTAPADAAESTSRQQGHDIQMAETRGGYANPEDRSYRARIGAIGVLANQRTGFLRGG
jgi:hypothetical protein